MKLPDSAATLSDAVIKGSHTARLWFEGGETDMGKR